MIQKHMKFLVYSLMMLMPFGLIFFLYNRVATISIDIQKIYDKKPLVALLVIGSGCAGDSAAVYGARGNVKTVDIAGEPGGQLNGTTKVENMPGLANQLGPDIMQKLQKQAEDFGAEFVYDSVKEVDFSEWPYKVVTQDDKTLYALTIVIATGASPLKLGVKGEAELWGKGVTTCAICDAPFHKGKEVVVIGGGDSAIEEALQLSSYASKVTILVRKDFMRAAPTMQNRLKEVDNVVVLYNTEVQEIIGNDEDGVTTVHIINNKTNVTSSMSVSGVFLAIGHVPNSQLFKKFIKVDADGYIVTKGRSQKTSLPGVFAAGDVEDKVYRQAGVAAGSGIRAALDALAFLQEHGINASIMQKVEENFFTLQKHSKSVHAGPVIFKITTMADFELLKTQQAVVVVDVYTDPCPSCKVLMPTFEKVAQKFADSATFIKINANEVSEIARSYQISTVPTILLLKNGNLVDRLNGAVEESELRTFIQQVL